MSIVHCVCVGHFDLGDTIRRRPLKGVRPLDLDRLNRLLAAYPREMAAHVQLIEGYVRCLWTTPRIGQHLYEFAYRLAREEGCMAVETGNRITYPPQAAQAQEQRRPQPFTSTPSRQ